MSVLFSLRKAVNRGYVDSEKTHLSTDHFHYKMFYKENQQNTRLCIIRNTCYLYWIDAIQHSVPGMNKMQPVQGAFLLSLMLSADPLPEGAYPQPPVYQAAPKTEKSGQSGLSIFRYRQKSATF